MRRLINILEHTGVNDRTSHLRSRICIEYGPAIDWLKANLDQTISIERLASLSNKSRSSLHCRFKTLTAMTPLQYKKPLRLHEALRLMLTVNTDTASAAHNVDYESPSQFNREYRRMFGAPPGRDVAQLRQSQAS